MRPDTCLGERAEKRKESGSRRKGVGMRGGSFEVEKGREDDQHRLLFTSLPIYTLTQTESISQSPDILLTPLCKGTSPWRLLVGVGDGTRLHDADLTAA